ncbi:MAG TPA: sterol desaturase family protein, partial [Gemmataceae bacterium]|nr:sterol desaturase family protein [Gemmataceae bacterium]
MAPRKVPGWLNGLLIGGTVAALWWLERRRPLRRGIVEPLVRRQGRNLAMAALSAASIQAAEKPVVGPLAQLVERRRWGLLQRLELPTWLEVPLGVALLDYTLYLWHILTHRVSFLWHFHLPHHVDLDMDASTALRFHFGEMLLSVPWRACQVLVIGARPLTLSVWQTATLMEIMFHHSNVELPLGVECWLSWLVVTPRMHGIHHSAVEDETNSNWSSGLAIWDRLHGTFRLDVPQEDITIGVPAYRNPAEVTLPRI